MKFETMCQKVWIKFVVNDPLEDGVTPTNEIQKQQYPKTYWKLHDISKYKLVVTEWYGHRRQFLQYKWERDNGSYGTSEIELKDYPPLVSKEHLILLCNIERPYIEEAQDDNDCNEESAKEEL